MRGAIWRARPGVDEMDLALLVLKRRVTGALLVLAVGGPVVGCKAPPSRPPIGDTGFVLRDGGVDAFPTDGPDDRADATVDAAADGSVDASVDAGMVAPVDGGVVDAPDGGPVVHPGTGTWSACIPEATDRICYFVPGAIAAGGMDITVRQRIAIDLDGLIHENGSVPPFDLRVSPTSTEGEYLAVGSSALSGGNYFDLTFMMGASMDGWLACNPSTRRFRVLQAGTRNVALEFELDCAAMPGVQLRGALVGAATFSGWRTDPIDGL